MHNRTSGVIVVVAVLLIAGCGKRETDAERRQREAIAEEMGEALPLIDGNNQFAFDLYAKLREEKNDNLFFSPYSVSTALAMTYAGARGETEKEMAHVLHFRLPQDRLPSTFAFLMAKVRSEEDGNQLRIANRLWGQQSYDFLPEFLRVTKEDYGAELGLVNFVTSNEEARTTINDWVEKQTENKIRDLVPPGILNDLTRLVLTNAIYFKGTWVMPFDKRATEEAPFKLAPMKTVNVPMMCREYLFEYGAVGDIQILGLPYKGDKLSMLIVLPKSVDGLAHLEKQLTTANLGKWLSALQKRDVIVYLPRFTMTSQFQMNEVLKSMGMPSAFSETGAADFSGMNGKRDLFIRAVIHKAFVDVNEEGTEAAAATAIDMECLAMDSEPPPPPPVFRADHPFVFFIRDNRTGTILFMGRVGNPKE